MDQGAVMPKTALPEDEKVFPFLWINERDKKPRRQGLTEVRGFYYNTICKTQLDEYFDLAGEYVDTYKYVAASMRLMTRKAVREINDICHKHNVAVSAGGSFEFVITRGAKAIDQYLGECRDLGFDIIEISTGHVKLSAEDLVRLSKKVVSMGLKSKPEVNIGAGTGFTSGEEMEASGALSLDPSMAIDLAKRHVDAGAYMIMMESEGITEAMPSRAHWRTDVIIRFANEIGLDKMMFEASDPPVFAWYITNFGPDVNLFIDHPQILMLENFRAGIAGHRDMWGRIFTYKG
jgi:phosphosulfolactate synthase (CoM biosynthesis protein A)